MSSAAKRYLQERQGAIYDEKKSGGFAFEFLSPSKLPDGTYYFRLLPEVPGKSVDGEQFLSSIKLPNPEEAWGHTNILLNECLGEDVPCYFGDLIAALNSNNNFKKLPAAVRKNVLEYLQPWERIRYVSAWYLDVETEERTNPKKPGELIKTKKYTANTSREEEQGIILDVSQKTIIQAFVEISSQYPDFKKITKEGRLLKLVKSKQSNGFPNYKVTPAKQRPLKNLSLVKNSYPDLDKFIEKMVFDYDSQRTMFLNLYPKTDLAILSKLIDLKNPGKGRKKPQSEPVPRESSFVEDSDDEEEFDIEEFDTEDLDLGEFEDEEIPF